MNRRSFLGWAGKAAVAVGLLPVAAEAAEAVTVYTVTPVLPEVPEFNPETAKPGVASAMGGIVAGEMSQSGWVRFGKGHCAPDFL